MPNNGNIFRDAIVREIKSWNTGIEIETEKSDFNTINYYT